MYHSTVTICINMFAKIVCLVALVALASAQHHHGTASSYSSISLNHVQHPAPTHHAAPALIKIAQIAPAEHHHGTASSYSSINLNHVQHSAPTQHAAPALIKTAHVAKIAPSENHHGTASSYSSINLNHVQHSAPTYHAAPVLIKQVAPIAYHQAPVHHEEHAHPKYHFKYGVEDTHTHDIKSQEESRDGDVVKGYYTLLQPDGIRRTVHYTADKNGFNADVKYDGHASHPEQVHKVLIKIVAPVHHSYHH